MEMGGFTLHHAAWVVLELQVETETVRADSTPKVGLGAVQFIFRLPCQGRHPSDFRELTSHQQNQNHRKVMGMRLPPPSGTPFSTRTGLVSTFSKIHP
jgi:hypothetical protein